MIIRLYAFSVALNSTSVFVGTSQGVYRAPKGQLTFTPLNNGLPTEDVYALYCEDSMMVASVDSSLYRSTDSGNSWTLVPTPIQRNCIRLQQFTGSSSRIVLQVDTADQVQQIAVVRRIGAGQGCGARLG